MRTSEVEFSFPVLGFTPDVDAWVFKDRKMLTTCGPDTLKKQMQVGMELVDADGRRWRVTSVRALGPIRPLWLWLIHLLALKPQTRIDQELEPLDPLSLDEIKARVCACYEAHRDWYEAEDEEDYQRELVPLLEQVRAARSVAEIDECTGLDSFNAY